MPSIRLVLALIACCVTAACDRSLQTADLTNQPAYRSIVAQEIVLAEGDHTWVLFNNSYDPLTNFSDGNVLSLIDSHEAQALAAGEAEGPNTPNGPFRFLGIADGATVAISRINQYGMETSYPVALGHITMPDGQTYPFEIEWTDLKSSQIEAP